MTLEKIVASPAFQNIEWWQIVLSVIAIVLIVGIFLLFAIRGILDTLNKNKQSAEFSLGKKSIKVRFNKDDEKEEFKKVYVHTTDMLELISIIDSTKTNIREEYEYFVKRSLRTADSRLINLMARVHEQVDTKFSIQVDFIFSFNSFVIEEVIKHFRTLLRENHLASKEPRSKDRDEFVENNALNMFNKMVSLFSEHWPLVKELNACEYLPNREEMKSFFRDSERKGYILRDLSETIETIIDMAIERKEEETNAVSHLTLLLTNKFHINLDMLGSFIHLVRVKN